MFMWKLFCSISDIFGLIIINTENRKKKQKNFGGQTM